MAKANYWQRGESLDLKNLGNTTIEAGTIIVYGARLGVAGGDILPGELGSIHVEGVYYLPKKDDTAIDAGTQLYWNPDADAPGVTASADDGEETPTAYVRAGYAAQAAAAGDSTVLVKINA